MRTTIDKEEVLQQKLLLTCSTAVNQGKMWTSALVTLSVTSPSRLS